MVREIKLTAEQRRLLVEILELTVIEPLEHNGDASCDEFIGQIKEIVTLIKD